MKTFTWTLYIALILVLAMSTFVEYSQGSAFVCTYIYHSPAFVMGWGLLVSLHVIVTTASECLGFYPNDEIKGVMLHFLFWKAVSGLKKKRLIEYCF